MLTEVSEQVEVVAFFGKNRTIPYIVRWQGREFRIKKISLVHQVWEGNTKIFYFSAICEQTQLRLSFNSAELLWKLEEIWTE